MGLTGGRWSGRGGLTFYLVRPVLALVLLVPVVTLFGMSWQSNGDSERYADHERHGVSYINALISVELALAESQTSNMTGRSVETAAQPLVRAIQTAAAADAKYGDELRTHERWAELRTKIESLSTSNTEAVAAYSAAEETAELLLALIEKVRTSSGLIRDPSADTYYLQDAAAQELPEAIVASSRLVGLAMLTVLQPATQDALLGDLLSSRAALASNVVDLADDVRQTVDTTDSKALGGNLLAPLDRFRQAVDSLMPAATALRGRTLVINPAEVGQSWEAARSAAGTLSMVMLSETDSLLADRLVSLGQRTRNAILVLVAAVLLAVVPPVVELVRWRRRGSRPRPPAQPPAHAQQRAGDQTLVPARGDASMAAAWGRSGAAR
mgnify:CR=1 FL=1